MQPASEVRTETAEAAPPPRDFAAVVRAHQAMVFSIAYHFLRDRAAAEELAQEVFLQLHRNLDSLRTAEHVTYWLRKVTSHRAIDYLRGARRRAHVSLDEAPEPAAAESTGDPLLSRKLQRLLAALPEKPRMVMILRYQEDLEPAEIAQVLEMPVATVKSHLQRSLAMLREKLARAAGEDGAL